MERNNGRLRLDGYKIKKLRNNQLLSQSLLVEKCNSIGGILSLSTLKRAEAGKKVYYQTAREIAMALQVDVNEITCSNCTSRLKPECLENKNLCNSKLEYSRSLIKSLYEMHLGHVIYIRGIKGSGKTHFINSFLKLNDNKFFYFKLDQSYSQKDLFRELLQRLIFDVLKPDVLTSKIFNLLNHSEFITTEQEYMLYKLIGISCQKLNNVNCIDARVTSTLLNEVKIPLKLVFEDIHSAEKEILHFINALSEDVRNNQVSLILSSRIDKDPLNKLPGLSPTVFTTLNIPALNVAESQKILKEYSHIKQEDMACLINLAKGNPYYLTELAKSYPLSIKLIPEKLIDEIRENLTGFSTQELSFLKAAASFGLKFNLVTVKTCFKTTPLCLSKLIEKRIIIQVNDENYEFYEEITQKGIYQIIPQNEKHYIHLQLASYFCNRDNFQFERHLRLADENKIATNESITVGKSYKYALSVLEKALSLCPEESKFFLNYLKENLINLPEEIKASIKTNPSEKNLSRDETIKFYLELKENNQEISSELIRFFENHH